MNFFLDYLNQLTHYFNLNQTKEENYIVFSKFLVSYISLSVPLTLISFTTLKIPTNTV